MKKDSKIYIAGHNGMVGSAVLRVLEKRGYTNLLGRTSKELDLRKQADVHDFVSSERPDVIIDAAAKVGGILANNDHPYQFLMDNMLIQNNLIKSAHETGVKKFIFLGSSCIYPKLAPQPIKEEYLLSGPLEPTNEWYAIAKISGVKLCEAIRQQYGKDFVCLMPTNLYGPNDNFDLKSSHVLPAMIRKFYDAKQNRHSQVLLWGSGSPMREFLYVDDMARAVVFAVENVLQEHLYNVGVGKDITIRELAKIIQNIVGHKGKIEWDSSKPDGTPRKLMDCSKLNELGWKANIDLKQGIKMTYNWLQENINELKKVHLG
ncbi:GDP-L-fucose synthase family protein [Costertonia aggregata]|uniref:GDP-L-fucose synthase n=1 Tax=Costertonia aggregata TaxID=343403 RepID=A0A7H9AMD5_9FLAO|nr:GDP-L-fucose synthase [Costertonia aggregata]QLG44577.1 GDP-L-fucose synthase [Costertonia aggregata]